MPPRSTRASPPTPIAKPDHREGGRRTPIPLTGVLVQFAAVPFWCLSGWFESDVMARFLAFERLYEGRHFDREIIALRVRRYLRFKLRFRDLVETMAERGLSMALTAIMRSVHHYAPAFERRWNRFAQPAGASQRGDEPYVKARGEWVYLCRAVDRAGNTSPLVSAQERDLAAARALFAWRSRARDWTHGRSRWMAMPHRIGPCPRSSLTVNCRLTRSGGSLQYLNNIFEQDHRGVKSRIATMIGFKQLRAARVIIAGIELLLRVRKEQFDLGWLCLRDRRAPAVGDAVLAAE